MRRSDSAAASSPLHGVKVQIYQTIAGRQATDNGLPNTWVPVRSASNGGARHATQNFSGSSASLHAALCANTSHSADC